MAPKGVLVRASVVARAIHAGARPSGTPVPALGKRPAGLALRGAAGLGTALRDGDVITSVAGSPATSMSAAITAIAGALRSRPPVITGLAWRGDQSFPVTVEIPWPAEDEPAQAEPAEAPRG
jgi:hypothetical protein